MTSVKAFGILIEAQGGRGMDCRNRRHRVIGQAKRVQIQFELGPVMSRTAILMIRRQSLIALAALVLCAISGRAQVGADASAQAAQSAATESPGDIISFLNQ